MGVACISGGITGFLRTGSKPSLIAGVTVGALYLWSGGILLNNDPRGYYGAAGASAILFLSSLPRFTKGPVPALLTVLSAVSAALNPLVAFIFYAVNMSTVCLGKASTYIDNVQNNRTGNCMGSDREIKGLLCDWLGAVRPSTGEGAFRYRDATLSGPHFEVKLKFRGTIRTIPCLLGHRENGLVAAKRQEKDTIG
ncbi:9505_t:CDS:2 [Acaulospora colombiana]|uniref:9500_t:CDS:1 n=2 Tax=Acaulospora colombiana TaxID=27376 RepID=A0ACA9M984_9GLOM|nr:9500_t:CDS:2 [Acaulospora colombiana]CAG8577263.1 9505_t:CDS:2 [Acaulospora colombiana]